MFALSATFVERQCLLWLNSSRRCVHPSPVARSDCEHLRYPENNCSCNEYYVRFARVPSDAAPRNCRKHLANVFVKLAVDDGTYDVAEPL